MKEGFKGILSLIQEIYEKVPDPVCAADYKLDIVWFNDAAFKNYPGVEKQQFLKIVLGIFDYQNVVRRLQEGESLILPLYNQKKTHRQMYFSPLFEKEGAFAGCLIQFFPNSRQEQMIGETQDYQTASGKIDYNYRSPFAVILTALKTLQKKNQDTETEPYFHYVYRNLYTLYKYNYMIAEITKLRFDEQFLYVKQSDLNRFLSLLCETVNGLGKKEGIHICYQEDKKPLITMFDLDKMVVALLNILSNAIASCKRKFSDAPEKIKITMSLIREEQNAVIVITDNGEGIPAKKIEKVMDAFYSCTPYTNEEKGLGMGLYLAKHIIEKHWGKLTVRSESGQGTTVKIVLPITRDNRPLYISANPKEYLNSYAVSFYAMLSDVLDMDYQ